jgi:hypothetical protein
MDEQVAQVGKDLQRQFTSREWGFNLKAGPECVMILAECKLLVSKEAAMAINLSGSDLPYV